MGDLPTAREDLGVHRVDAVCPHCDRWKELDLAALVAAGQREVAAGPTAAAVLGVRQDRPPDHRVRAFVWRLRVTRIWRRSGGVFPVWERGYRSPVTSKRQSRVDGKTALCNSVRMDKRIRLDIYPSEELRLALDRWRIEQPGGPTRAEAARWLLEEALITKGAFRPAKKAAAKEAPASRAANPAKKAPAKR